MKILPRTRETLVLPFGGEEVEKRLWQTTYPVREGEEIPDQQEAYFLFNGWVKNRKFRISRKLKYPEAFLPILKGLIEESSTGSIVLIKYRLFFGTAIFVVFWTIVTLLIGLYFLLVEQIYLYALISVAVGLGNYLITTVSFYTQVKKTSELINKLLS